MDRPDDSCRHTRRNYSTRNVFDYNAACSDSAALPDSCHDHRRSPNPTIGPDFHLLKLAIADLPVFIVAVLVSTTRNLHVGCYLSSRTYPRSTDHTETADRNIRFYACKSTGKERTECDRRIERTFSEGIFVKRGP